VAAAYPRWGWSDLIYSLVPNGTFADWRRPAAEESLHPVGVAKRSGVDALYIGGTAIGYLAPKGSDPTADVGTWREKLFAGEPYGADVRAVTRQFYRYKSATALSGRPAPLLIMDGWTDPAFNAVEALRAYNRLPPTGKRPPYVALQLGDLGHFRAGNAPAMYRDFGVDGAAFFARFLKGRRGGPRLARATSGEAPPATLSRWPSSTTASTSAGASGSRSRRCSSSRRRRWPRTGT
jgi:hypothetical protein